jgi:hypothetical protein
MPDPPLDGQNRPASGITELPVKGVPHLLFPDWLG